MSDPQPPLTDRELRIIRGMIDEYDYRLTRRHQLGVVVGDVRVLIAIVAGILLIVLQAVSLALMLAGRR